MKTEYNAKNQTTDSDNGHDPLRSVIVIDNFFNIDRILVNFIRHRFDLLGNCKSLFLQ